MSSCLSILQSQAPLQSSHLSTPTLRLLPWEPLIGPAKTLLFPASQALHSCSLWLQDSLTPSSSGVCLGNFYSFVLNELTVPSELSFLRSQCPAQRNPHWIYSQGRPPVESGVLSCLPLDHSAHWFLCESISLFLVVPISPTAALEKGPVPLLQKHPAQAWHLVAI